MTTYIYARVSTNKQNITGQLETLSKAYPDAQVYHDKATGKDLNREAFRALDDRLVSGDKVVVYDLSRLGRNTADLIMLVEDWNRRDIGLVVYNLGGSVVDTSTATGRLMFTVLSAVDQMQRELQAEKAAIGMAKAVAEGKMKGRQASPETLKACQMAMEYVGKGLSKETAAKAAGIGVATLYRYIKQGKRD
ncbi:DNA invertase [Shewanella carassii]|uniref:recombinase family protein n=1 Tax=Shewanella carassii TaxID=1987584 RepID=UPI001BED786B|nr:recombinase family protein [Shewanella carassii]BCV66905.1 DNA invertase [Shewanella carassii]